MWNHFWDDPVFYLSFVSGVLLTLYIQCYRKFKILKRSFDLLKGRWDIRIRIIEQDNVTTKLKVKGLEDRMMYIFYRQSIEENQNPENETTDK